MKVTLSGQKELKKKLHKIQNSLRKVELRSVNATAQKVRTQATKKIGQEVVLTARYIKGKLRIEKARKNKDFAIVFATSRGVLLSRYGNRQLTKKAKQGGRKNAGISVKVKRRGPRKKMPGAFYIRLKDSEVMGIAVRKKGRKGRHEYDVIHGPSVSQIWNNVRLNIKQDAKNWFYDIASRELNREIQKSGLLR